ncbi:MAG: hypothetical protein NZ874_03805 [Fimbriimonadales bacterium]|nr:hypothetical protein [Fimbriimonadales bacterium]
MRLPDTPPPDAHAAWEQLKATAVRGLNLPDDALRRENLYEAHDSSACLRGT